MGVGKRSEEVFSLSTQGEKLTMVEGKEETGDCRHSSTIEGVEKTETGEWSHCRLVGQPQGVLEVATSLLEERVSRKEFSSWRLALRESSAGLWSWAARSAS